MNPRRRRMARQRRKARAAELLLPPAFRRSTSWSGLDHVGTFSNLLTKQRAPTLEELRAVVEKIKALEFGPTPFDPLPPFRFKPLPVRFDPIPDYADGKIRWWLR